MSVSEPVPLSLGDLQVYDHFVPPLVDGVYAVRVEQTVSADPGGAVLARTQSFTVRGTRWMLDPAEVHARFPAPHASGTFGEILPNLVFSQRALPWERRLHDAEPGTPWMALLVLHPGELHGEPGEAGLYTRAGTVAQLLEGDGVRLPAVTNVTEGERAQECRWIEVPAPVFREVMPRLGELRWLAHCRQVNTADKPALGMRDEGWFSVVVASRLPEVPAAGAQSLPAIVHLVSLEGIEALLRDDAGFRAADGSEKPVRMVSLHSWSFQTLAEPGPSFHALARALARPGEAGREGLMLRRAVPPARADDARPAAVRAAEERLRQGFSALDYQARTGDRAFAWYRGPLAPVLTQRLRKEAPFPSASAAMVWDAATATFDHSLSAAWSVGRALALGDADFALRMLGVHARAHRLADRLLARVESSALPTPARIGELLEGDPFRARVARMLDGGVSDRMGDAASAPAAPAAQTSADAGALPTPAPAESLQAFLAREDVRRAIREDAGADLEAVGRWLGRLCLLEGVPFSHLVPDPALLPPESLRFFYLDAGWMEAAMDGALSVGAHTGRDRMVADTLYGPIRDTALRAAAAVRAMPVPADGTLPAPLPEACGGILLRSALVSGWPGLSVRGTRGGEPLPVLRMERLSGSVLLCLWAGVPDRVELAEPQEGLRYGVSGAGEVHLRSVQAPVGRPLDRSLAVLGPTGMLRGRRVLNLRPADGTGLLAALAQLLGRTDAGYADPRLSPSELAVQMVQSPARLTFSPAG
jgi:hypothetical protein